MIMNIRTDQNLAKLNACQRVTHHRQFQGQGHSQNQSWPGRAVRGCSFLKGLFSPTSHTQILQAGHLQQEDSITKS